MGRPFELSISSRVYRFCIATWVAVVVGAAILYGSHAATHDVRIRQAIAAQKEQDASVARQIHEANQGVIAMNDELQAQNATLQERIAVLEEQLAELTGELG